MRSNHTLIDLALMKEVYKARKSFSHKGTFGHALMISGEKGKMGAAILCTMACLKAGAGLVTAMVPDEQFAIIQTAVPEAMAINHEEVENIDFSKYNTVGIGPGIGAGNNGARVLQE